MKRKNKPGNFQTLLFFVGFILLFFLVFALGVIVGKGLTDFETLLSKNSSGQQLIATVTSIFKNDNPEKANEEQQEEVVAVDSETEIDEIVETINEMSNKEKQEVTETEVASETDVSTGSEQETSEKKEPVEEQENVNEKAEVKTPVEDSTEEPKKEEEKVVAKLDYSIPEFPKTDPGGKYTIQLGSFQNIDTAYKLEKYLNEKGYPSFVIKAVIPERGTWYRVRVGTFNDKQKAIDYAEKIKNKEKLEFSQITLNN